MEYLVIIIFCFVVFILWLIFLMQGPPFVRSNDEFLSTLIEKIEIYKPKKILDMGSGDGKVVIALAKKGYTVDGIEINPFLVLKSRSQIRKLNLQSKATIIWGNFWSYKTSKYDVILLYVIKHIMPRLEAKLIRELDEKAYIFSNYFVFPHLKPFFDNGRTKIYKMSKRET